MGDVPLLADALTYRIDGRLILEDVSLSVARGELVALVGPNGAGKSTVLRALSGAIRTDRGSVCLGGIAVQQLSRKSVAQTVATVPQVAELSFDLTGLEFALMGRHPHLRRFQLEGRRDMEIALEALNRMGVESLGPRSVLTLSGGERQCVYLARGLAQEPVVLLADEPVANLDLAHQLQVMSLLQRLAKDGGLAVLVALHQLDLGARFADRLVLLCRGRVVAEGAPAAVLTREHVRAAFGVEPAIHRDFATGAVTVTPIALVDRVSRAGHNPRSEEPGGLGGEAPHEKGAGGWENPDPLSPEGRARKRAEQAAVRRHPRRRSQGLVLLNTGNGKGKTTAALGLLLRAWGRGMRVVMFQFLKARTANWGEHRAAKQLKVEIVALGDGFTWMSRDIERDRALAQEGWRQCKQRIESGGDDIVVLDELTYLFKFGWLDVGEVIQTLRARPAGQHVIITGRDAPQELVEFADLVTDMREVKHPYSSGVRAQPGIEF